jgi:hypothetical protein
MGSDELLIFSEVQEPNRVLAIKRNNAFFIVLLVLLMIDGYE